MMIFLGCVSRSSCVEQTTVIAAKMGYPKTITKLRNRTDNWLRDYRISKSDHVQNLRSQDLELRAEGFTILSKYGYFELEKKIDNAFEQLYREFIAGIKKLDLEDASLKKKKAFVLLMIQKSEQKIEELHRKESSHFAN
jgi:hypothetical protein